MCAAKANERAEYIRVKETAILFDPLLVDLFTSSLIGQKHAFKPHIYNVF